MSSRLPRPEFSRLFNVANLKTKKRVAIEATEEECLILAQRMKVSQVNWVRAQLVVSPWKGRVNGVSGVGVQVVGLLDAQVVQPCSATLASVSEHIEEDIKYKYISSLKEKTEQKYDKEIDIHFEEDDPPEDLMGDEIDLGALAAEVLGLSINPYPRKEGVQFNADAAEITGCEHFDEKPEKEPENHPFASLSKLKPNTD